MRAGGAADSMHLYRNERVEVLGAEAKRMIRCLEHGREYLVEKRHCG